MRIYILHLLAAVFLAACTTGKSESNKSENSAASSNEVAVDVVTLTAEQVKIANIKTGKPELKKINSSLKVNGVVEVPPGNIVSVTFPLGGFVKSSKLLPGMRIGKGSLLATLEDSQYIQLQQDYLINLSKLEFAEADYKRQATLNTTQANSERVYQQAKTDYESQKILVRALSEKLKLIGINPARLNENNISRTVNIYSPINGYVSEVNVNSGKYVNPTDVLFELINPSDAHLNLTAFEKDATSLMPGQRVVCYTNANPSTNIMATTRLITPKVNKDRSVEVHCDFDRFDSNIRPGTFMNAEILLGNQEVNAVPDDSIVRWQNQYYVFVVEGPDKYRLKAVKTGTSANGYTEIRSQLPPRDIVVKNAYTLLMKLKNNGEED